MKMFAFMGGIIAGAAGLTALALWDAQKTEKEYAPCLKTPEQLNANELFRQLNSYYFKAQNLLAECNSIMLESSDLISTPIDLPDDSFLQKAANLIGGKMNTVSRRWKRDQLLELQSNAKKLYGRYQGVFKKANDLLSEHGKSGVDLSVICLNASETDVNESLDNDDWIFELENLADIAREYLEKSCEVAEELISRLESIENTQNCKTKAVLA